MEFIRDHLPSESGVECVSFWFLSFPSPSLPLLPPILLCSILRSFLYREALAVCLGQLLPGRIPWRTHWYEVSICLPPTPPWKAAPLFLPSGRGWPSMQGWSYCGWVGLTRRPHNKMKFTHSVETGFHWLTALGAGGMGGMGIQCTVRRLGWD